MATSILLSVGKGATSDYLDLTDHTKYIVFDIDWADPEDGEVVITLPMTVRGTGDGITENYRALWTKHNQASEAVNAAGWAEPVTLGIRLGQSSEYVYFIVKRIDGLPQIDNFSTGFIGNPEEPFALRITAMEYAEGDVIDVAPSGTITGGVLEWSVSAIPGDCDPLTELHIVDESDGYTIHGWLLGRRAVTSYTPADFQSIIPTIPIGTASSDADADTIGGTANTVTLSTAMQNVARAVQPNARTKGHMHVFARTRNDSPAVSEPLNVEASFTPGPALKQSVSRRATGTSSAPQSNTFSTTPTAGRLLVLSVGVINNGTGRTITGVSGGGWTIAEQATIGNSSQALLYKISDGTETGPFTITLSGSLTWPASWRVVFMEWSGIAATSPLDVTASNTVSSGTSHSTGTTAETAQANSLVIAAHFGGEDSYSSSTYSGAGWTRIYSDVLHIGYKVTTATAVQGLTLTSVENEVSLNLVVVFKGLTTAAPTVPADTYQIRVVSVVNANLSSASVNVQAVATDTGAFDIAWDAPVTGTPATYRVYVKPSSSSWRYFSTTADETQYFLSTISGGTTEDPPEDPVGTYALLQARVSLLSGDTIGQDGELIVSTLGDDLWHWQYMGSFQLPPEARPIGVSQPEWIIDIRARKDGNSDVDLSIDSIALLDAQVPSSEVMASGSLSDQREWIIGVDRYMRHYAHMLGPDTDSEEDPQPTVERGQPDITGPFFFGPGDNIVTMLPILAGGISRVTDIAFSATAKIIPRYRHFRGGQ